MMISQLSFLAGAGAGAAVVTACFIVIMAGAARAAGAASKRQKVLDGIMVGLLRRKTEAIERIEELFESGHFPKAAETASGLSMLHQVEIRRDLSVVSVSRICLQYMCTRLANLETEPMPGYADPMPWGCILSERDANTFGNGDQTYCDGCPAQHLCPNENKRWSK